MIRASAGVYLNRVAPTGVVFDGGSGVDTLGVGNGGLALAATVLMGGPNLPLIIDQTAGRAVDMSQMNIFPSTYNRIDSYGTTCVDILRGNTASSDVLLGLEGNDRLYGHGGAEADMFVFATGSGRDVISDFGNGADVMDFLI